MMFACRLPGAANGRIVQRALPAALSRSRTRSTKKRAGAFRQSGDDQRIKPAGTFDADAIPKEAPHVRDFGDMRQRQMFVGAPPGRQPKFDQRGGDADMVGRHAGREQQPRESAAQQCPQAA